MAALENSGRSLLKATHTPITIPRDRMVSVRRSLEKAAFLSSLVLHDGEISQVRQTLQKKLYIPEGVWNMLATFEPSNASQWQDRANLAEIPSTHLITFGTTLVTYRQNILSNLRTDQSECERNTKGSSDGIDAFRSSSKYLEAQYRAVLAKESLDTFSRAVQVSPIGLLHLERIEMTPVGIERGELLATIPLAPGETTAVEQKEWTVTEEDLSTIVTDSLEDFTEKGVTEKSELAQATTSESKRNQQMGVSATLSGSYGFVTFSTSTTINSALDATASQKESRNQARDVTAKASSRVRKERKVTIQTKTVTGSQETTTREIRNTSPTNGMRIDYFSMMRKWRVRLLQYGLRQTYDIAIPSPGSSLRMPFIRIRTLTEEINAPFQFDEKVEDINESNYRTLATKYGAAVAEPPGPAYTIRLGGPINGLDKEDAWHFNTVDVDVPDNYEVGGVVLDAMLGNVNNDKPGPRAFMIFGYGGPRRRADGVQIPNAIGVNGRAAFFEDLTKETNFMKGVRGRQSIHMFLQNIDAASVTFVVLFQPTAESRSRWQFSVWQSIRQAAADSHYSRIQAKVGERDALVQSISAIDTLTLRREERDEIMRGVLRWLLGPLFEFMPASVASLFAANNGGFSGSGNRLGIDQYQWGSMFRYQEMVKFLHQAIEWENLLYFVYPYFWDQPNEWDFVRTIVHPDPERQQFLRAGSARVVLTVRPGLEEAFSQFVDTGAFGTLLPPGHPYLTIGEEIAAFGRANYPGVPPANPSSEYRSLLSPGAKRAWAEMGVLIQKLEAFAESHSGSYPTTSEGLVVLLGDVPSPDPWGNPYSYKCPGRFVSYELSSAGPDGIFGPGSDGICDDITSWAPCSLIAEWFEYTPSRGTDIAVNTVLSEMA